MNGLTRSQRPELPVWPAFDELFGLSDELVRFFDNPSGTQFLSVCKPAIDIYEDADNLIVNAELPGLKKEDIDVSLHDGVLSISGERKSDQKYDDAQTHRSERFVGTFNRSIRVPSAVKADEVKAQYNDGILTVTFPKADEAKRKQIEVKFN